MSELLKLFKSHPQKPTASIRLHRKTMKSFKLERNNSMEYYTATEKIEKDLDVLHAKILKIL